MTTSSSQARIATPDPSRYITRLCKHFAHKAEATWGDGRGRVVFPFGTCTLTAEPGTLVLEVSADDADALAQLEDVVARHLLRFAERHEELTVAWSSAPQPS